MNWLSVLLLAIPVMCMFYGMQRGMVRTAFSVAAVIVSLMFGSFLSPYISEFFRTQVPVYDAVQGKCQEIITESLEMKLEQQADTEKQNQFIEDLSLPDNLKEILIKNNNEEGYSRLLAETFGEYLAHSIARIIVETISWMLAFAAVNILLNLISRVLDRIFSLPGLSFVNRVGGAALGVVRGVFIIWVIYLIIMLFWGAEWSKDAILKIMENRITGYLYQNNLLLEILSAVTK